MADRVEVAVGFDPALVAVARTDGLLQALHGIGLSAGQAVHACKIVMRTAILRLDADGLFVPVTAVVVDLYVSRNRGPTTDM